MSNRESHPTSARDAAADWRRAITAAALDAARAIRLWSAESLDDGAVVMEGGLHLPTAPSASHRVVRARPSERPRGRPHLCPLRVEVDR